jgi:hypothetical protein
MTKSNKWQRIGEVPVDTGRLVLLDPMNADDVGRHEAELAARYEAEEEMEETEAEVPPVMTYKLITNEHGIAVALIVGTGLGDGLYPVEARFEEAEGSVRIAEIRVRFLPHPVIGYELPR